MDSMKNKLRLFLSAMLMSVLAACASPPLQTKSVNTHLLPNALKHNPESVTGTVLWGGVIISSVNLPEQTQLEVLGYPLDRTQRPMSKADAVGRFLVNTPGYLETVDYAEGRLITVVGSLQGVISGTVGQAQYDYPSLRANKIHLWNERDSQQQPRFIFGIGVSLSN